MVRSLGKRLLAATIDAVEAGFYLPAASHAMNPFPSSSTAARLFTEIRRDAGRPGLVFGRPRGGPAADEVLRLRDEDLLGGRPADRGMASALKAGLLLLADHMEDSHALSQDLDTPEGSYWHGILHRREPDYGNARYWFRALGNHPLFDELGAVPPVGKEADPAGARWDPFRFIDLCEQCIRGGREDLRERLEELQEREIVLLLAHCHRRAVGGGERGGAP
jgi:hypothetical protein